MAERLTETSEGEAAGSEITDSAFRESRHFFLPPYGFLRGALYRRLLQATAGFKQERYIRSADWDTWR